MKDCWDQDTVFSLQASFFDLSPVLFNGVGYQVAETQVILEAAQGEIGKLQHFT
jgi:hypothetical protein